MGIERISVSAKIKPRNRAYMDELKQAMLPFDVSDSAIIDGVLSYADSVSLTAEQLHGLLRKDRQESMMPVMVGPYRIDPLNDCLEAVARLQQRRKRTA